MKKLVLFVMAVIGFAGMSVAQDVWSSGFFTEGTYRQPAVYKNSTRMYYTTFSNGFYGDCTDVDVRGNDVYWVRNCLKNNEFRYSTIMKNNDMWMNPESSTDGSHIYDLYRSSTGSLFAAGCKNVDGLKTAVIWRNNETNPICQCGNGYLDSEAFGVTIIDGYVYSCGYQNTSSNHYGVIWKDDNIFHSFANGTKLYGIAYYDGFIYTVGTAVEGGNTKLIVWGTNLLNGSTFQEYVLDTDLNTSLVDNRFSIYIEAGDIYVNGMDGSSAEKVWKNGTTLYSNGYYLNSVVANTNGIYYAGCSGNNTNGKIWKDGSVLYSPSNCDRITNLFIAEPECTNSEVRSLPFTDGFENGTTSLPCWTMIDVDNQNGTVPSYWHRIGRHNDYAEPASGDHGISHRFNFNNNQDGWLISPRLYLQPGQSQTTLTFKTYEEYPTSYTYEGVWISNSGTATSNFTQLWTETSANNSWRTVTVDLKDYQGEAVYIAFRYAGLNGHNWFIDDVSVTESFTPCNASNAPYSCNFQNGFTYWNCWTAYDIDMTPSFMVSNVLYDPTWAYNESGGPDGSGCMLHHWGPSGIPQTAWLFSKRITLPTGNYNYTLSFKSRSQSSGTGKKNTVWLAPNESGAPNLSNFTIKLWEDPSYSDTWTTYTVDLTPYKGNTVTIGFKYEGTYAHNWYLDDFAISQEVAEYTITANANNNAWGTVTGGGSYPAGATCSLHATPNSGYVFQNWKKNGTIVSTNPNYSFEVTENATYTAYFGEAPVTYYTITTNVTPTGSGTVTGGGTFPSGSSTTLTATANLGYTFSQWQDGNTSNPRTLTVTGDATYTAQFTQDNYIITTNVTPPGAGTVTGGGAYHYGDNVTLTATPNANYEFAGWHDGNTDNPRSITVTGNETYTAIFNEAGITMYSVTANVSPAGAGTVTGTGTFEAGATTQLYAHANPGYTFDHWSDGVTLNPRTITVTSDLNFTAYFTQNQYIITVVASPSNAGTVSGGGAYYYGSYATLTATAYPDYEFQGWSDGSSENPHQVLVTDNATYTATFSAAGSTYYTVSAYVSPTGAGTVSGTGSFPAGSTTTLTATANSGYVFDHWNDGVTTPTRTVTVNNNMSFTAYFNANQYTITVNASPAAGGTVSGGGTYPYGATATLTATPNSGYSFMQWSDGNTDNPRTVTVTGNATFTALFMAAGGETFMLTVTSGNQLLGQVAGGGIYPAGVSVEIRAIPSSYARFVKWNDDNTDNPRTVVVNDNLEFVAEFVAIPLYTITVNSSNNDWGYVLGGGTFIEGTETQISAFANTGYMFAGWNDGNNQNPRTITVTGNATYTAQFVENTMTTYTLNLICNTSEGTVSGGGVYIAGTTATIQAFPNPGYVFTKWSDDNNQNPRTITVNSNMSLAAFFATGIDEDAMANVKVYPNPTKESIRLIGIEANSQVEIYNSLGELVRVVSASENQEINVRDLASGLYMVRCGNATLRFVKEQ